MKKYGADKQRLKAYMPIKTLINFLLETFFYSGIGDFKVSCECDTGSKKLLKW